MVANLPRLGVLGCGWIAGNRLRQIQDDGLARVVAIADVDSEALDLMHQSIPEAQCAPGPDQWAPDTLDGVMISTPSALHCAQATRLLQVGLPVFVQKPIGLSAGEVDRVLDAAAAKNLPVETDLCYRHLASAQALRHALRRGTIGRPFRVEGFFHNAYRPASSWSHDSRLAGGGALMDLGIHLLDLVMWLTGARLSLENTQLLLRGRHWKPGRPEDFAGMDLELPDGAPVRLACSWDASTGFDAEIGLRIFGEHGTLELRNRDGSFFDFYARLCRGTEVQALAQDDGDHWQAGPLREWLVSVGRGRGYQELPWVRRSVAIIEEAYDLAHGSGEPETAVTGTVHAFAGKGVLQ